MSDSIDSNPASNNQTANNTSNNLASILQNISLISAGANEGTPQHNDIVAALLTAISKGEAASFKIGNQTISINVTNEANSPQGSQNKQQFINTSNEQTTSTTTNSPERINSQSKDKHENSTTSTDVEINEKIHQVLEEPSRLGSKDLDNKSPEEEQSQENNINKMNTPEVGITSNTNEDKSTLEKDNVMKEASEKDNDEKSKGKQSIIHKENEVGNDFPQLQKEDADLPEEENQNDNIQKEENIIKNETNNQDNTTKKELLENEKIQEENIVEVNDNEEVRSQKDDLNEERNDAQSLNKEKKEKENSLDKQIENNNDSIVDAEEEKDKIDTDNLLDELMKIEAPFHDPVYNKIKKFVNHLQQKEKSLENREKKIEVISHYPFFFLIPTSFSSYKFKLNY